MNTSPPDDNIVCIVSVHLDDPVDDDALDDDERQRAARFIVAAHRTRYVARRAALRQTLGRFFDVPPASVRWDAATSIGPRAPDAANKRHPVKSDAS